MGHLGTFCLLGLILLLGIPDLDAVGKEQFPLIVMDADGISKPVTVALGHLLSQTKCPQSSSNQTNVSFAADQPINVRIKFCVPDEHIAECRPSSGNGNGDGDAKSNSLLLCYPGHLVKGVVDGQLVVENRPESEEFVKKCADLFPNSSGSIRSIQLKAIFVNEEIRLELTTSFSQKKYEIVLTDSCHSFDLVSPFADGIDPFQNELSNEAMTAMNALANGDFLTNHAGLWLLAMDLAYPFTNGTTGEDGAKTMFGAIRQGCPISTQIFMPMENAEKFAHCKFYWAKVVPGRYDWKKEGKIMSNYVVRVGYVEKGKSSRPKEREEMADYVEKSLKLIVAKGSALSDEDVIKWAEEYGNALENIPIDDYFFAEISEKLPEEKGGPGVEMLLHECEWDGGSNAIFASIARPRKTEEPGGNVKFNWKDEFILFDNCIGQYYAYEERYVSTGRVRQFKCEFGFEPKKGASEIEFSEEQRKAAKYIFGQNYGEANYPKRPSNIFPDDPCKGDYGFNCGVKGSDLLGAYKSSEEWGVNFKESGMVKLIQRAYNCEQIGTFYMPRMCGLLDAKPGLVKNWCYEKSCPSFCDQFPHIWECASCGWIKVGESSSPC